MSGGCVRSRGWTVDVTLYQVLLPLSVIVTLLVVARLYYAIRVLNERVTNLSRALTTLKESTRRDLAQAGAISEDTDSLAHFVEKERALGARMHRDFSLKKDPLMEMFSKWRVGGNLPPVPGQSNWGKKSAKEIRGRQLSDKERAMLRTARDLKALAAQGRSPTGAGDGMRPGGGEARGRTSGEPGGGERADKHDTE